LKRANMQVVAARAGVSKATVSHVINQTRKVKPETRQRVLDAIAELDYRPNLLARSLTTQHTGIVGMVISDSSNYFYGELIRGVEEVLLPNNYALLVCNTNDSQEREAHYLELLLAQRVDGIVTAATSKRWLELSRADAQRTPVVHVDRSFDGMLGPFVGVDNCQGAYLAVRHLVECGHASVGLLAGYPELISTARGRAAGYKQALCEANLPLREEWIVPSGVSIAEGRRAMHQLLTMPERPRAVFANNNLLTLGALLELRELGLRCPEDVALAGFDDHPWAEVTDPPLTMVRQPARQLGQSAADILLALIRHQPVLEPRLTLPCSLIIRRSSQGPHGQAPALDHDPMAG